MAGSIAYHAFVPLLPFLLLLLLVLTRVAVRTVKRPLILGGNREWANS